MTRTAKPNIALTPVLAGALGLPYKRFIGYAMAGGGVGVMVYLLIGSVAGSAARQHEGLIVAPRPPWWLGWPSLG